MEDGLHTYALNASTALNNDLNIPLRFVVRGEAPVIHRFSLPGSAEMNASVNVTVNASDKQTRTADLNVTVYVNREKYNTRLEGGVFVARILAAELGVGNHTVYATVADEDGRTTASEHALLTVTEAPRGSAESSANNTRENPGLPGDALTEESGEEPFFTRRTLLLILAGVIGVGVLAYSLFGGKSGEEEVAEVSGVDRDGEGYFARTKQLEEQVKHTEEDED